MLEVTIRIGDTEIKNSEYEKLLGIKVNTKLNFNEHLNDIISKASRKIKALSRVMPHMSLSKKKKLVSSFFNSQTNSQTNYCPLIWMFHSRVIKNKINRLHERCFRLLHGDKSSSFEKLLEQDKSVAIHARNLQILAKEMFKVYPNISPPIFSEIFHRRDINFNLQINSDFAMPNVRSVFHGSIHIYCSKGLFYLNFSVNLFVKIFLILYS